MDPFTQGVVAGALAMLAALVVLRFVRGSAGSDLAGPPRSMTPPSPRPVSTPPPSVPTSLPLASSQPVYDSKAVAAIADALNRGEKIEAIKLLRAATGLGLAEAKASVEDMERKLKA
jgi:hypothetical protein